MCGITGYISRGSGVHFDALQALLKQGEKRGHDGFGYHIDGEFENCPEDAFFHSEFFPNIPESYDFLLKHLSISPNTIFLSNHRAAPETESETDPDRLRETLQPIVIGEYADFVLVHNGSVSNFIVNELKEHFDFETDIDSEAIIRAYQLFNYNMKDTMEYLSGGFAFLLLDNRKRKLYAVCSHNPLYCGFVKGYGLFYSSTEQGILDAISEIKGIPIIKNTINIWEDYYVHRVKEYTINEIDLQSFMVNETSFKPRYVTNNFDPYLLRKKEEKTAVLVSASSGLDSSTTLAVLKRAGMNPIAVHFNYGHRGGDAEWCCIERVTKILDVPLYKFDISEQMGILDSGMLTDKNAKIITGTDAGLKTTAAWTVYRNHLFMTYMAALAEKLIMSGEYSEIYLTGGFMNLTESGCIVDCEDNLIQLFDNSVVTPGQISVGTELLSYNFETNKLDKTTVQKVFHTSHKETYKISVKHTSDAITKNYFLYLSGEHPIHIVKKGWVKTKDLNKGDGEFRYNFTSYRIDGWEITDIEIIEGEQEMLNFYCEPNNNFFVNKILTHNSYPDNSERFVDAALKFFKYSITGTKLKPLYGLCNILKTEQYILLRELGLLEQLSPWMISCDRPIVYEYELEESEKLDSDDFNIIHTGFNCSKDGKPACGSGLLSWWAAKMAGVPDLRKYYEVDDKDFVAYEPKSEFKVKDINLFDIVKRLEIPDKNKQILIESLKKET